MPRHKGLPATFNKIEEWARWCSDTVNGLLLGKSNNTGTLTLTPNAVSTVLSNGRITSDTIAFIEPTTASAVTALAAGIRQSAADNAITFTHASNAAADQTFRYALVG